MDMAKRIDVNNGGIRQITETTAGWNCELMQMTDGGLLVPDRDLLFWNFHIPRQYLLRRGIPRLEEIDDDRLVLQVMDRYIQELDALCDKSRETHLYRGGELVQSYECRPKAAICQYLLSNHDLYPDAKVGYRKQNDHFWVLGAHMNITGIYFFRDLEARPVVEGREVLM
jgi:hypothetical protein